MIENIFKGTYVPVGKEKKRRALLVIDVQNEYFEKGQLPVCYPENTLPNIIQAINESKKSGIDVIIIQHTIENQEATVFKKETFGWKLHDSISSVSADLYIEKKLPSSFYGTNLQNWLDEKEIDTVVICGYMTQFCCDSTAKHAFHLGYNVEFLSDATATLGFENYAGSVSAKELHNAILVHQAVRFSQVLSTSQWINCINKEI